ncbi:MAG TPA: 23S rRNA pseudouridine(1911/1915/1917) synthase RluD [Candidatus Competibacteraceae bacterium]|nr:23S rRNA pseudouridine(1911/1915/1917) synthase RluD [Candidatus Competibacteraceae bacterium]
MPIVERIDCLIPESAAGQRLDQALAGLLTDHSRARLQEWLKSGRLTVDGRVLRPRDRVLGGEHVLGEVELQTETAAQPQDLPLDVRYEDADLIVLAKPAGMVVHPAAGNPDGTLVNALLHRYPELANLPRAGVVHRLDKDTSGLLVVARSPRAHTALVEQLQNRAMGREYLAVACGVMSAGGTVDQPIGRHGVDRQRMSVTPMGKSAVTHYRVLERFRAHTYLRVRLETGRTHQIRVHLAHIRYPLLGDPVYGGRLRLPPGMKPEHAAVLRAFRRQALHAARLTLQHPASGATLSWAAELPADMAELLQVLRQDQQEHSHDEL